MQGAAPTAGRPCREILRHSMECWNGAEPFVRRSGEGSRNDIPTFRGMLKCGNVAARNTRRSRSFVVQTLGVETAFLVRRRYGAAKCEGHLLASLSRSIALVSGPRLLPALLSACVRSCSRSENRAYAVVVLGHTGRRWWSKARACALAAPGVSMSRRRAVRRTPAPCGAAVLHWLPHGPTRGRCA